MKEDTRWKQCVGIREEGSRLSDIVVVEFLSFCPLVLSLRLFSSFFSLLRSCLLFPITSILITSLNVLYFFCNSSLSVAHCTVLLHRPSLLVYLSRCRFSVCSVCHTMPFVVGLIAYDKSCGRGPGALCPPLGSSPRVPPQHRQSVLFL